MRSSLGGLGGYGGREDGGVGVRQGFRVSRVRVQCVCGVCAHCGASLPGMDSPGLFLNNTSGNAGKPPSQPFGALQHRDEGV